MNVLVLGSSGQVGSALCIYLRNKGIEVTEWDIVRSEKEDMRNYSEELLSNIEKTDFIFFLAFDVGGSRYLSKYQHTYDFFSNNIKIMDQTFNMLMKTGKPFVFASSQMSNMSYSPYGVAKAVGENYTRALDGLVVKFWNVYGIEHDLEKSHVITDFILKAKNTGIIDMMTDGQEEREFLYADDCCEALVAVMENYDVIPRSEELCITSFESTKIIDIANIIAEHFSARVVPADQKDSVQMNKKNQASRYILKYWNPKTSIREGVGKIIEGMSNV
jgi:nucleoside-diphosphate-sugar epimerase